MPIDTDILLCDCSAGYDDTRRFARLDELTLTYDVVERRGDGEPRVLRRHVASLREARAQACATGPDGVVCPLRSGKDEAAADLRAGQPAASRLESVVAELAAIVRELGVGGGARPGSVVRVADQAGRISDFELTDGPAHVIERHKVGATSPIGRELLGAAQGDWLSITVSNGRRKRVQVIDVMARLDPHT